VSGDISDNIDLALLISSQTDFTSFETSIAPKESQSQTELEGDNQADPTVKESDLKTRGKGTKKRKRSLSPGPQPMIDMLNRMWDEEKEETKEKTEKMMREDIEDNKAFNVEMLGHLKSMADSFSRMVKD
jgi:hypothetical protein